MTIEKATISQLDNIFQIFKDCRVKMESEGIFQWTEHYPAIEIIANDIRDGYLYCLNKSEETVGVINISDIQEQEYKSVHWQNNDGKILVIHRLAVHPKFQKQGFAKKLMDFAEDYAVRNHYSSVRLDAFSGNDIVLRFYENSGYQKRGAVFFPGRELPFYCYEKQLKQK